jgi:tetratricopeptide (TPR) repeat protein
MSESDSELEERAERAIRRGELISALELYESLLAQRPDDERMRQRMESVRALLQPSELVNRRRSEPEEQEARPLADSLGDAELGELHAGAGRFVEALRCYERALAEAPTNELLRERLEELRRLAPPGVRANLASAERLDTPTPARGMPRAEPPRSQRLAHANFALDAPEKRSDPPAPPARPETEGEPKDDVDLLESLLRRVRTGRRDPSGA